MTPEEQAAAAATETPAPDPVALAATITELREQIAESNRTAQFWADKAAAAGKPAAAAATEEDEPDVLEAITTGGAKGFDALAAKRGFIKRDEVETLINQRATSLTKEQELIQRFPDLKDKTSDFFKQTAGYYGDLLKQGVPQATAMELAADKAELALMRTGKIKPAGAQQTKEEKEADRVARVQAQAGEGSGRRPAAASEEDTELTPDQKHIAAAMGVSEEAYQKRAKAGVAIKSR